MLSIAICSIAYAISNDAFRTSAPPFVVDSVHFDHFFRNVDSLLQKLKLEVCLEL